MSYKELSKTGSLPLKKQREGLGDLVHDALGVIGITEERVAKVTGKKCNCSKRRKALNKLVPFKSAKKDPFETD